MAELGCEIVQGDTSNLDSIQYAVKSVVALYIYIHTISVQPAYKEANMFMNIELKDTLQILKSLRKWVESYFENKKNVYLHNQLCN